MKQLVIHLACCNHCYNYSVILKRQNGVFFEEAEISQEQKGLLLRSFIIFPFAAWPFFWYYHLEDSFCSYFNNYLINYEIIVLYIWLCNYYY